MRDANISLEDLVHQIVEWNVKTGQMAESRVDRAVAWQERDNYRELTKRIFLEEVNEVLDADPEDYIELLDGIADVFFTLIGLAGKAGAEDYVVPTILEVVRSNQSKLEGDVVFRSDGKIGKGSAYFPPDIPKVIASVDAAIPQ